MESILRKLETLEQLLKENRKEEKEFLTVKETAAYLGQSTSSIYKLTASKDIPYYDHPPKIRTVS